jgi:hypothetical protein
MISDDEEVGAAPLEPPCRLDHQAGRINPAVVALQDGDVVDVERPHEAARRMQPAKAVAHALVDEAIVFGRAFPAHAAQHTDDLLRHARRRRCRAVQYKPSRLLQIGMLNQ